MTMETVRQKCRPKHQILVLKCYPQYQKGVQEVKPNPSELSYLLYYVSTRRSKLPKVSAFLEKRAARDVWRRKIGNVQVTLQILSALIEKVPRDLPIFARSVLTVIETVLRSRDISMVEDSIATFETFCRHQDMAALSAEQDFANQYQEVVRIYAGFAHGDQELQTKIASSPPQAIRWKNAGLRAIKGVVSSEAGLAADGGVSLRIILPVILENLYNGDDTLIASLEQKLHEAERHQVDPGVRRRYSAITVQTVDTAEGDPALAAQNIDDVDRQAELDMRLLALRCLEQIIVNGSSRGQIRVTTRVVLEFILRKGQSNNNHLTLDTDEDNWATSMIGLIAKWCPVQARFLISTAAMEVLFDIIPTEGSLDSAFTVIYMIDWLLKSPVNMIGLSVIDVLLGLMRYMSIVVAPRSERTTDEPSSEKEDARHDDRGDLSLKKKELLSLLQKCIGDITTHIYYGDQVVDMIRAILTRIMPASNQDYNSSSAAPDQLDGIPQDLHTSSYTLISVKVCALKAIKNILLVANSQRPSASAGVESRNPVGIHVWEGTHYLLQDPEKEVRYAYVDAILYWLKLETTKNDLRIKDRSTRAAIVSPRRDLSDASERASKRATGAHQREKAVVVAQSNFLRMLHLTIYENALQRPEEEVEIRVLHLLLAGLVQNLGINAARFGLPMILRLQDDILAADSLRSPVAMVNIGSLVYGYLWALLETFDLDTYRVGKEIFAEIEKRKNRGLWLDGISSSLSSLDSIIQDSDRHTVGHNIRDTDKMSPFKNGVEELVRRIEESYNDAMTTQSPPGSPGRNLGKPVIGHAASTSQQRGDLLPSLVREQMLSPWSKQSTLEAAEREKSAARSINGSRTGSMPIRGQPYINGTNGSSVSTHTPSTAHGATGGIRRMSMPDKPGTPNPSSSRDSPIHVNELRRVLSVNTPDRDRRLSPLRGRLDASNRSIISSSSESMVSGFSTSEFEGDGGSIRPQSTREGQETLNDEGMETPRALMSNGGQSQSMSRASSYTIPPVPPIPSDLSIPGGFPNDSQRSLPSSDRPVSRKQNGVNGKVASHHGEIKSLKKQKSRTSNGQANGVDVPGVAINGKSAEPQPYGLHEVEDTPQRRDVQKLLDSFLTTSETDPSRPRATSSYGRRTVTGGIGRPPY
ncbi:Putative Protein efr3 [Aspergillus calidoustus]|uniref:Protein efr3 n=1 Tax=Aspergillus calidoustus TaxID=454130 RepID=A0A0U5H1I5_ASPCI|nr:Putative Protein efr3 [Aspergillus calidoustus]